MMDNQTDMFDKLDDSRRDLSERRQLLVDFLHEQLFHLVQNPKNGRRIAYEIAGLLATKTAHELPVDDPSIRALDLAGNLELPEDQNGGTTWSELAEIVDSL